MRLAGVCSSALNALSILSLIGFVAFFIESDWALEVTALDAVALQSCDKLNRHAGIATPRLAAIWINVLFLICFFIAIQSNRQRVIKKRGLDYNISY